jgi:hypothetical protein
MSDCEALVVSPKRACAMLDITPPTLRKLISAGKLDSYKEGDSRKVTVASIKRHIITQLSTQLSALQEPKVGGRGRPRRQAQPAA